jgi:hypothetical protein
VDLSDVVEEGDALDALALVLGELGGFAEDEAIRGDAADVRARVGSLASIALSSVSSAARGEPLGGRRVCSRRMRTAARRGGRAAPARAIGRGSCPGGGKTRARAWWRAVAGRSESRKTKRPTVDAVGRF